MLIMTLSVTDFLNFYIKRNTCMYTLETLRCYISNREMIQICR